MHNFRVGDTVRVVKLVGFDGEYGYSVGDVSTVVKIHNYDIYLKQNPDRNMNFWQLDLVVEEKVMSKFNVGDKVCVTKVVGDDAEHGYSVGDVSSVVSVNRHGDCFLKQKPDRVMLGSQLELVVEEKVMTKFNVGDRVRLIELLGNDSERGYAVGDISTVVRVDGIWIYLKQNPDRWICNSQLELVVEEKMINKVTTKVKTTTTQDTLMVGDIFTFDEAREENYMLHINNDRTQFVVVYDGEYFIISSEDMGTFSITKIGTFTSE
jgi:hypothetical protein